MSTTRGRSIRENAPDALLSESTEPDRKSPWTEGEWRWHVGHLRAMGRHALADELDGRFPCPSRPLEAIRRSGPDAPPRDTVEALEAPQNATGDPPRTSG